MRTAFFLGLMVYISVSGAKGEETPGPESAVEAVLDSLHEAASKADGKTYFSLFSPDAVFLGTDAGERWPIAEFQKYGQARFDTGTGWTYTPRERHVDFSPGGKVAWFDEILRNEKYGICRGSGVLRLIDGKWKISQYHLTVPVPNDLLVDVVKMIRSAR